MRAAQAVLVAEARGCEVLVFVRDVDREHGAKRSAIERRRKIRTMHEQIEAGFSEVASVSVVPIKATPCRMLEAWALGDARALEAIGADRERVAYVPSSPEDTWGAERDPSSGHPKCVLRRVLGRDASATDFEDIARESRPDHLAKTCPDSFAPFLAEANQATSRLEASRSRNPRR